MSVEIETLLLRWEPGDLLYQRFHLAELSVSDTRFEQLRTSQPDPDTGEPLSLPELSLPIRVRLERVEVKNFRVIALPGADPVLVDHLLLRAAAKGSDIMLSELRAVLPEFGIRADGRVRLRGDFPLTLNSVLDIDIEDAPKLRMQGRVTGNSRKLKVKQTLSGDLDASIEGELRDPLDRLAWTTHVSVTRVGSKLSEIVGVALPSGLNSAVTASGDLQQADALFKLNPGESSSPGGPLETERGDPESPSVSPALKLTGTVRFDGPSFEGKGEWHTLQWPLVGAAEFVSESGTVNVSGTAQDYRFGLHTQIEGPDIPRSSWRVRGNGNTQRVYIEQLHANLLDGTLAADGHFSWAPRLDWRAGVSSKGINPARLPIAPAADWSGSIDLAFDTSGAVEDERIRLDVDVSMLTGSLRERPLSGQGKFAMDGNEMRFDGLRFGSGDAMARADGRLGPSSDLDWNLQIPDLADLLPGGSGSIQAEGKLLGDVKLPTVKSRVEADAVALNGFELRRLTADIDVAPGVDGFARVSLKGSGLGSGDHQVENASLTVDGPLDAHRIRFTAKHPSADVRLDARGGLDLGRGSWSGFLERLDLDARGWGEWRLKSRVEVLASAERARIAPLCLRDRPAELCAEADWQPAGGTATVSLGGFELERLRPLLPEGLTVLSGVVRAGIKAKLGPAPSGHFDMSLEPGRLTYRVDEEHAVELSHRGGRVEATLGDRSLLTRIRLEVGRSGLDGEFEVPRAALDKVRGRIDIPEARIELDELPRRARRMTSDLVIVSDESDHETADSGLPVNAEVTVTLGDEVHFRGFGVRAQLGGRITLRQRPGRQLVGQGEIGIDQGSFRSFGQQLTIERGRVFYAGGSLANPGLNIRASRQVGDLTAGVDVTGTLKRPAIRAFSSDPGMQEADARSLLLTGTTPDRVGDGGARFYAGRNLGDRLSVGTNFSVDGNHMEFFALYQLTRRWSVRTSSSAETSGTELLYTIRLK